MELPPSWVYSDAFNRLFNQICVDALMESGLYDEMKCHPETRELILERLENSVAANAYGLITWLDGPMGSGKTSVAVTMAGRMSTKKKLIGSFVFRRGQPGRNEDTRFVATLAYQMALSIPLARPFIEEQIYHDHSILHQSLSRQLDALILNPLRKMKSENRDIDITTLPNLIIVDGLDECGPDKKDGEEDGKGGKRGKKEQQLGVLELLHRLALAQDVLPFSILVHSRPEMHIKHWFSLDPHDSITNCFTLDSSYNPSDDIRLFVTQGLLNLLETHPFCRHLRGTKWPYEVRITIRGRQELVNAIELIVKRSEGLFVYASTVMRLISSKDHRPAERLSQILEGHSAPDCSPTSPYTAIDALYIQILDSISNSQVAQRIFYLNLLCTRRRKSDFPPSTLVSLLSISMDDFNYFLQQTASILTLGTESLLTFHHSSLAEFLSSYHRSQHWCIKNYKREIGSDLALNAIKSFSLESCAKAQLSYLDIPWWALYQRRRYPHALEDQQSLALVTELKHFFDYQNSSYLTPVMRLLTSESRSTFLETCIFIFGSLKEYLPDTDSEKWAYPFGSHIGTVVEPQVKQYLKNPRSFAVLMGEAFGVPASNTDYTEDIPPPTDCEFASWQMYGREWAVFFRAPADWLLHVFSIPSLDFLCEAFTILLKHAGQPSVMFHQGGTEKFLTILRDKKLSQELWLTILDYDEVFTPYLRRHIYDNLLNYRYYSFRPLHYQHQYCLNPILPFQLALGQCYWEPPNNTHDISSDTLWFLKESSEHCWQILIPSVPPLARYMVYCISTGDAIPVRKDDVHCPCSGDSCFDRIPDWMRV